MSDEELFEAFYELRPLCTNIIGFHDLSEVGPVEELTDARRVIYDAQIYAGAIELARRVTRIIDALKAHRSQSAK
ncbi:MULTISPECIES: hypothetical protein [Methylobacterium]|uniref:hypothetical protein n=1 Tax=Bacteria TaxID=2 RepID=UPI0036FB948C